MTRSNGQGMTGSKDRVWPEVYWKVPFTTIVINYRYLLNIVYSKNIVIWNKMNNWPKYLKFTEKIL